MEASYFVWLAPLMSPSSVATIILVPNLIHFIVFLIIVVIITKTIIKRHSSSRSTIVVIIIVTVIMAVRTITIIIVIVTIKTVKAFIKLVTNPNSETTDKLQELLDGTCATMALRGNSKAVLLYDSKCAGEASATPHSRVPPFQQKQLRMLIQAWHEARSDANLEDEVVEPHLYFERHFELKQATQGPSNFSEEGEVL
ncbi:hypothetical protein AK812_SmicGene41289 [Symbiodinium microadriaticum]|uniref:Uncharacterized protein n=1 Tax=Symbiodinium microadriaticum TaxID=2951 RepID=A0A1Q9C6L9_SYMMI|nr:hypothetical protein AK812_SmicGene41289 [Symbiodinium microadriaticum]